MSITRKIIAALVVICLALFAGAALILETAVRPQFEQLEASSHERNRLRLAAALDAVGEDLRSRVTDYAQWDDTYAFMGGENAAYPDDFSPEWFVDYRIDLIAFGDPAGRVVWADGGEGRGSVAVDRGGAEVLIAQARAAIHHDPPPMGVTWIDGLGFVMFAAAPATRNDGTGEDRGLVVIGRKVSETALIAQSQLEVRLISLSGASPELAPRLAALGAEEGASWIDGGTINSLTALRDPSNRIVGAMLARQPREISALGSRSLGTALALFAVMSAVAAAALWLVMRSAVTGRLKRMERHFNAQEGEPEPLANDAGAGDEIARLINAYNALVQRTRDAGRQAHDARSQRDAAAANHMKSDFLAKISHELRTPLNGVIGYAELISEDLGEGNVASAEADLGRITGAARHLLSLVNEVLDVSKIEAGTFVLKPHAFDVSEMLREATDAAEALARERGCSLNVVAPASLGIAYSDQARLRQCLVSVLSAAFKFAEGGAVELIAERRAEARELRFTVRNTRARIGREQLALVMDAFAESNDGILRQAGGSGLGLAITRKIAALLGGAIDADADETSGVTFVVTASALLDAKAMNAAVAA